MPPPISARRMKLLRGFDLVVVIKSNAACTLMGIPFYLIRFKSVSNNIYKSTTNKVICKYFLHKVLIISNMGVVACG